MSVRHLTKFRIQDWLNKNKIQGVALNGSHLVWRSVYSGSERVYFRFFIIFDMHRWSCVQNSFKYWIICSWHNIYLIVDDAIKSYSCILFSIASKMFILQYQRQLGNDYLSFRGRLLFSFLLPDFIEKKLTWKMQ